MTRLFTFLLPLALLAGACGDDADTETTDDSGGGGTRPSVAGDWILETLTVDGTVVVVPDGDVEMTIALGGISGDLGCNSFFGDIDAADDGSLTVGTLGQTEMACEGAGRMEFESTYGQALSAVTAWAVDPTGLTLSSESGPSESVEIRYSQAPPAVHQPLVGTVWHFDTIYSGEGVNRTATNRADMDGVTLVIEGSDATLVGPGCLGATIAVEFDDGSDGEFRTAAGGDLNTSPECGVVGEALDGLASATGFMVNENRLTFIGAPGETVGFSAVP